MAELIREIVIDATPETIWPFLTDADKHVEWVGTVAEIDPRPGGTYRVLVGGQHQSAGEFVEVVPNEKVVFTFGWEEKDHPIPPGSSTVEITLQPEGDKTRVRWGDGGRDDVSGSGAYTHMTLLFENTTGMHNLFRLSSRASLEGYYFKPRMDRELLSQYSEGLIATTGCPSGEVQTRLRLGQYDEALASEDENQVNRDVRIVAPEREGYAVVRVIAALPSQSAMANDAVDAVSCSIDAPEEPTDANTKPGG